MSTITSISTGLFRPDHWALRTRGLGYWDGWARLDWTGVGGRREEGKFLELPVDHHITSYLLAYGDAVFILDPRVRSESVHVGTVFVVQLLLCHLLDMASEASETPPSVPNLSAKSPSPAPKKKSCPPPRRNIIPTPPSLSPSAKYNNHQRVPVIWIHLSQPLPPLPHHLTTSTFIAAFPQPILAQQLNCRDIKLLYARTAAGGEAPDAVLVFVLLEVV